MKNKKLALSILTISLIGAGLLILRKFVPISLHGIPNYCVNHLGEARPFWQCLGKVGARRCAHGEECIPTCGHGCLNKNYEQGLIDCEAIPEYECECIKGFCQVKGNRSLTTCGIENCHGLDITCGPNIPEVCDMMYMAGDNCRQYASCEIINGKCQLIKSPKFEECKSCVERCKLDFKDDQIKFFKCESKCTE